MSGFKEYIKEFGFGFYFIDDFMVKVLNKLKFPKNLRVKYANFKHKKVRKYLLKNYGYLLNEQTGARLPSQGEGRKTAYVFWWQGEGNAPEVVKTCIDSLRRNSGAEVVVLSQDNYKNYVDLPDYIIDKMQSGKMGLAVFSDIVRFNLLYRHGGVWIDSTCLVVGKFPDEVFSYSFYSINSPATRAEQFRWTSFFLASRRGDPVCGRMAEFYNEYWRDHDCSITYLLTDCWLNVLYENVPEVRGEIDAYPLSDVDFDALAEIIGEAYDESTFKAAAGKSFFHKLTYKLPYREENEGKLTVWGFIKNNKV